MDTCRILLVDDHKLLMEGIRSLLSPYPDIRVVGMATSGEEAVNLAAAFAPHVVIMDVSMPGMGGVEATKALRSVNPTVRVIIYTMHTDQRFLLELVQAGIVGHVCKSDPPGLLLRAVEAVRAGQVFFSGADPGGQLAGMMRDKAGKNADDGVSTLSPREKEVFRLLADGQSIRAIADSLHISPKTVETHKYNLLAKLRANSLSELIKIAIRHGLASV